MLIVDMKANIFIRSKKGNPVKLTWHISRLRGEHHLQNLNHGPFSHPVGRKKCYIYKGFINYFIDKISPENILSLISYFKKQGHFPSAYDLRITTSSFLNELSPCLEEI